MQGRVWGEVSCNIWDWSEGWGGWMLGSELLGSEVVVSPLMVHPSFSEHVLPGAWVPGDHLLLRGLRLPHDAALPGRHPRLRQHPPLHPEDQEHVSEDDLQVRDGKRVGLGFPKENAAVFFPVPPLSPDNPRLIVQLYFLDWWWLGEPLTSFALRPIFSFSCVTGSFSCSLCSCPCSTCVCPVGSVVNECQLLMIFYQSSLKLSPVQSLVSGYVCYQIYFHYQIVLCKLVKLIVAKTKLLSFST